MNTNKIVGIAILMVCVLLPVIVFFITAIIEVMKDVMQNGDYSGLLALLWFTVVLVGCGLLIF